MDADEKALNLANKFGVLKVCSQVVSGRVIHFVLLQVVVGGSVGIWPLLTQSFFLSYPFFIFVFKKVKPPNHG